MLKEPGGQNQFPLTDFSGGRTGDAWWVRSKLKGLDLWGERRGDEFDIEYSEEETGLNIHIGMSGELVGLNLNQMLVVVYNRWSGELSGFMAGLGKCVLDATRGIELSSAGVVQATELLGQGKDILASLDLAEQSLDLLSVGPAGVELLGQSPLREMGPNPDGYELWTQAPTRFMGISLEFYVSRESIDLHLFGDDAMAVDYKLARRVDLSEVREQRHPSLASIRRLVGASFLTLKRD